MTLRELAGVLHGRPRQCDALDGVLAESAAFFSPSAAARMASETWLCGGPLGKFNVDSSAVQPHGRFLIKARWFI